MDLSQALDVFTAAAVDRLALATPLPDAVATAVVEHLKAQADNHWYSRPQWSLILAERIIAIGQARADVGQQALGHMARGDALKFDERHEEAWRELEHAGALYQSIHDEVGWARTRIGRLHSSVPLKRVAEALADLPRAEAIFQKFNETERLLRLQLQAALVYLNLAEINQAAQRLALAQSLAAQLGPGGDWYTAVLHINWGNVHLNRTAFAEAEAAFQAALSHAIAHGESLNAGIAETNLGWLNMARGRYRQALLALDNALLHTQHQASYLPNLQRYRAECYLHLNRFAEASALAQEAAQALRQRRDEYRLAHTLVLRGIALAHLGQWVTSEHFLSEASGIFQQLGATLQVIWINQRRSQILLKRGDAQQAFDLALQAAQRLEAEGVLNFISRLVAARAALRLGDYRFATSTASAVLQLARRHQLADERYAGHMILGHAAAAEGQLNRARRHYQAASAVIERLQRDLTTTLRDSALEDKDESLHALIALNLRLGDVGAAWATLERAKAQLWLGYWHYQDQLRWVDTDPRNAELLQALNDQRVKHQILHRLATGHLSAAPVQGDHSPRATHEQLAACERRLRELVEELHRRSDRGLRFDPAAQATLAEIQKTLTDETILLEYYTDGDRLWCFVMTTNGLTVVALPAAVAEVTRWLKHLQFNLETLLTLERGSREHDQMAQQTLRLLARLWSALLEPLALPARPLLPLVIVPYGALHLLPFHLLHDGHSFLFESAAVSVVPAASLRALPSPQRPGGARVIAHSWGGRLSLVHREARQVHQILGGDLVLEEQATREVFRRPPVQVLHIAAHGHYRPDQPDFSYLELADGQLYADDLFQHDFGYELVTLSACETGQVTATARDDLIGLGRGFLYAGAGSLLQSLWRIPDESAAVFMTTVYAALSQGETKERAVRKALAAGLSATGPAGLAEWGAFQLVGHAGPLSTSIHS